MFDSIVRHKRLLLLTLGLLVLIQITSYYWISRINEQIETLRHQNIVQTLSQDLYHQISEKQAASTAIALTLANDVSHLLAEHNDVQYQAFNDLIAQITQKSNYKNLWVQVMDSDGDIVYRNWTKESTNDAPVSELKLLQAPRKDIITDSFDLTIRITTPIFHQKLRVGFLCLISHFNSIQRYFEGKHIQTLAVVPPELAQTMQHPFSEHRKGGFYIANLDPNPTLMKQITGADLHRWTSQNARPTVWQDKLVVAIPLRNLNKAPQGTLLAFYPLEATHRLDAGAELLTTKNITLIANITLTLLLLSGLVTFLIKKQRDYFQRIINAEEEIVLVSNGERLIDANQQLYNHFDNFRTDKRDCICDYFVEEDGFLQKYMGDQLWLDYLLEHRNDIHRAKCVLHGETYIFKLKAHTLLPGSNLAVVVLVDITELEALSEQLLEQSRIDELTQIGNRRFFNDYMEQQISLAKRHRHPLSLIFFDIDHFKKVNDVYGHQTGDVALRTVVDTLSTQLRESDVFFRVGGEEFMIVLAHHPLNQAKEIAERLRKRVERIQEASLPHLTISLGVAELDTHETLEQLLHRIDLALYEAKSNGRNCVCTA
ncbi:sensor domain-containing diguanylate cyclase [Hydrogenovibrio thermophilus]|uniref:diguanylate cyclase n=1 Tax=Hydrogenovibrio thermophilus TaxID=265883 RepID=A0A410H5E7_9GAMM|nr:GGDEF domain-containing protein [Hydrogenovibrio thermophilus]QAB16164.1 diguanylate cyclase [Hydrogenovibrio thermophilus]